jgi:hypothetical protein
MSSNITKYVSLDIYVCNSIIEQNLQNARTIIVREMVTAKHSSVAGIPVFCKPT